MKDNLKHISNQQLMDELEKREKEEIILISHSKKQDEVNY
jgi:hypothetical protein